MGIKYCGICEELVVRKEIHGIEVCGACYDVLQCIAVCGACGNIVNIKACIWHEGKPHHHSCYKDVKATRII